MRLKNRDFHWYIEDTFPLELIPEIEKDRLIRAIQNYFIFAFFYSNYHTAIIDLCKYVDANGTSEDLDQLYSVLALIRPLFLKLYSECLENHPHPKIYYERGMVYFHSGDLFSSLLDMKAFMQSANEDELEDLLTSDFYLQEGASYAELGQYDEAIEALTKSILKDPENKEAYFERATTYFEMSNFDLSIKDYFESNFQPTPIDLSDLSTIEFSKCLISGILEGSGDAVFDFIPSLLASANGLSHGLWALACDPANCSKKMIDSCKEMLEFLSSSAGREVLEAFIPEIKDFNTSQSREEKATLLGFMIGKYGTEIFAPAGALKAYKNLRSANRLLTLQYLSKTSKESTVIKKAATKWSKDHLEAVKKFKTGEEILNPFKGQFLRETTVRKIIHQAGFPTFPKPAGIPGNFRVMLSRDGGGMKYVHPLHTHESVRVMPGIPHGPNPCQQKPYVIHMRDGMALDPFGNKVPKNSPEAHIPIDKFVYRG